MENFSNSRCCQLSSWGCAPLDHSKYPLTAGVVKANYRAFWGAVIDTAKEIPWPFSYIGAVRNEYRLVFTVMKIVLLNYASTPIYLS